MEKQQTKIRLKDKLKELKKFDLSPKNEDLTVHNECVKLKRLLEHE